MDGQGVLLRVVVGIAFASAAAGACGRGGRVVAPEPAPSDWCKRVAGGPSGRGGAAAVLELSAAHAGIRFFGVEASPWAADLALARALAQPPGVIDVEAALPVYVQGLRGACVVAADDRELGPARVERVGRDGKVALVRPGTGDGPVALPAGTVAVVIDLRELPAAPGLREALERAVAPALAERVARPARAVRLRTGMDDEVFAPGKNTYRNVVMPRSDTPLMADGDRDMPIVLLTGVTMAPDVAAFAGALRIDGRAWIYGEDVLASVAESRWSGIGARGITWRSSDMLADGVSRWPDRIAADRPLAGQALMGVVAAIDPATIGSPPPLSAFGRDARPSLLVAPAEKPAQPRAGKLGELRAALIIAHGALRLWYPYFHVVGDRIDQRLLEVLASIATLEDSPPPREAVALLARFGEAIDDGHNFVRTGMSWKLLGGRDSGYLGLLLTQIGDQPVVVRSVEPGINPGDTLVSIGGRPVADFYAEALPRTSAATAWHRYYLANRRLLAFKGPTEITLRDPAGSLRSVTVQPSIDPQKSTALGFAPSRQPAGFLGALGAPDIYYLNLSADVVTTDSEWMAALTAAEQQGAAGLVVDMRGYPTVNHYKIVTRLVSQPFRSPIFIVPQRTGPAAEELELQESAIPLRPESSPSYGGPIVLLVGPGTVSAAENFSMMLVGAERVVVVGRTSAGTNGTITGVQLPGGFTFTFTGMEVRFPNGCRFHGVGIVPDVVVVPTAADLAAGRDVELEEAIRVLRSGRKPVARSCN